MSGSLASGPASDNGSVGGTPNKKRKTSKSQVESGVGNLLDSTGHKSRAYIVKCLEAEGTDDLASLIADMLRDGDLHVALSKRKNKTSAKFLGPVLPIAKKNKTTWKMLGRRVDRLLVDAFLGRELFEKDEASLKVISGIRYQQLVSMALNQSIDNQIPTEHTSSRHENPLVAVSLLRYRGCGERLSSLTKENAKALAYFYWASTDKKHVFSLWLDLKVVLPIPEDEIAQFNDWVIESGWSIKKAKFSSKTAGRSQFIYPLIAQQFPGRNIMDEELPFEYPQGALRFGPSSTSSASGHVHSALVAEQPAAASQADIAAAGALPPLAAAEEEAPADDEA
jgi:hypothetical protein